MKNKFRMQSRLAPGCATAGHLCTHWVPLSPNKEVCRNDPHCDKCGGHFKILRPYNHEKFCLACLAQIKFGNEK